MNDSLPFCPEPPDWRIPWEAIGAAFPWIRRLQGCPQDPEHHAEGDVWVHTRLVCEALAALPAFRARPPSERAMLFAAALLHDVAKPDCTRRDETDRIVAPGHSRRGAIQSRTILWRLGVPIAERELIAALVRFHQRPFFLIDRPDSQRLALEISQVARCDLLALLAEADARGRICADQTRLLDNVALFSEYCEDQGCWDRPYPFSSDHARFLYFRRPARDPAYLAHDDCRVEVTLVSGLPGAGKDHWIREYLPDQSIVSLDQLRAELRIAPTVTQGLVVHRARELARDFLRRGQPFIWNATNLSRAIRDECITLFDDYRARTRIVYLEANEPLLLQQNRSRAAPVPEIVIQHLLSRWEVPDLTEAHRVDWIART